MNILLTVIVAGLAIAAMMTLRLVVFRRALEERLKAGDGSCKSVRCFQGCSDRDDAFDGRTHNQNATKRSDSHAP